jgi:hypothetical protein
MAIEEWGILALVLQATSFFDMEGVPMAVIDRIAFYRNRRDEVPNQELAKDLSQRADLPGIREIAENLTNANRNVRSNCLKVLYEIAYERPDLIAPYADDFIRLLSDKSNRMVWGAMIGLGAIAANNPKPVLDNMNTLFAAMDEGTLITRVWGIRAISRAASTKKSNVEAVLPKLKQYLKSCNPRDVPTHLESMLPLLKPTEWKSMRKIVESRRNEMTSSHLTRLGRVVRQIENEKG